MRAYTYKPEEAAFPKWPEGILRLEGTTPVEDPRDADVFVVPPALMFLQNKNHVLGLPYLKGNEERHVFFDVSDFDQVYNLPCLFIRCNLKRFMRDADPNSIPWAWPVDNYHDVAPAPAGGLKFDVSFHGWYSTEVRKQAALSCQNNLDLKVDIAGYPDFYGYVHRDNRPEADRRMAAYKASMHLSRVMLCGQSIPGVFPYRFFEAMSAGRVPLLFCSDYNLPWKDEIDYESFSLLHEAGEAHLAGRIVEEFVRSHDDATILEMGREARAAWLRYLNRDDWPRTMTAAVEKKLKKLGVPCRG